MADCLRRGIVTLRKGDTSRPPYLHFRVSHDTGYRPKKFRRGADHTRFLSLAPGLVPTKPKDLPNLPLKDEEAFHHTFEKFLQDGDNFFATVLLLKSFRQVM
ncbi:uncharacterized protein LOC143908491 [Temnothorax americanus]|uniref:uncharacterized protein LOC143908491 n=1 Tax=Temnothorax americanus TaxID=1964332 RepID=UPI004068536E